MADKLTKAELEDLKAVGYVEGNFHTFPDNVSPILKAKALEAWKEEHPEAGPLDLPTAVERQNEIVRERAAAGGDKVMQDYLGVDENGHPKRDPLDHDNNGRKGGVKK